MTPKRNEKDAVLGGLKCKDMGEKAENDKNQMISMSQIGLVQPNPYP